MDSWWHFLLGFLVGSLARMDVAKMIKNVFYSSFAY